MNRLIIAGLFLAVLGLLAAMLLFTEQVIPLERLTPKMYASA